MSAWAGIRKNDQVHAIACFYAATEAIMQGHHVDVVSEDRRYRLRANGRYVQVFAQRAGAWQVSDVSRPLAPDTDAVIFVDLSGTIPDYYAAPADWFREDVDRHHREFMNRIGGVRPRNPRSRHQAIDVRRIAAWHRCWQVLG